MNLNCTITLDITKSYKCKNYKRSVSRPQKSITRRQKETMKNHKYQEAAHQRKERKPILSNGNDQKPNIRIILLQAIAFLLFGLLLHRTWELQIVKGEKYAEDFELKITRTIKDSSTRGLIYDCNGDVLAYNRLIFTVTMVDEAEASSRRGRQLALNGAIYRVIRKLEENEEQISHELPIEIGEDGKYAYTIGGQALIRLKADIMGMAKPEDMTWEQRNMSAEDMIEFLSGNGQYAFYGEGKSVYTKEERESYGLPDVYTPQEILAMAGIRYMLSMNSYKKYVPVILARGISEKTAAYIAENSQNLPGISVGEEWERVYTGGEACSHILGYIGGISTEEMEIYAAEGRDYSAGAMVGKAGIEQYLEKYLQGTDGEREIIVNNVGKIVGEDRIIREAVSGKDVYLSIDKDMQMEIYHILEQSLADILAGHLINAKEFDMTKISDTTDIRIPIYDVYTAFIDNDIIRIKDFYSEGSTELEERTGKLLEKKKAGVVEALQAELLGEDGDTILQYLPEEMVEYFVYLVKEAGILKEEVIDKEDEVYLKWKDKSGISMKEFLLYAIGKGWIDGNAVESGEDYVTAEEMYRMAAWSLTGKVTEDVGFMKLLFKWMVREGEVTGKDICLLLYDQQILVKGEDYEKLLAGTMDAFSFLKKKIEQLEITPAQLALEPCSASAVVVSPKTGKVLALVSYPGYDNNRLANQMDASYYRQLLNDKSLPLYNRATQQLTAPGSTFKPITIVAGLQEGVIAPDSSVLCDGVFDKVTPSLKCWKHTGHGMVGDASTAIQFSCNDYLCEIAYRMGMRNGAGEGGNGAKEGGMEKGEMGGGNGTGKGMEYADSLALNRLREYAALFCLDEKSGVEIAESAPHITDAYGIPSAIGQGTHNYATVQLARYVNILASEGGAASLSLIKGIADEEGIAAEGEVSGIRKVELPDEVWNTVRIGMVQFAQNNPELKDMGINIAGKTGTAQESPTKPDHGLFVGYAPVEAPEITVAVRIVNGYGSSYATAVGRSILEYCFDE